MEKDGMLAAVFPTPTMQGVIVSPRQLQRDIEEELSHLGNLCINPQRMCLHMRAGCGSIPAYAAI